MSSPPTPSRRGDALGGTLMIIVSALLCLGALMVFSAGAGIDQRLDWRHFWRYSTLRRVAFVPAAWLVLAVLSRCDYRRWLLRESRWWLSPVVGLLVWSVVLLVLVLIPGVGSPRHDSYRWLQFSPGGIEITFQPSELAKWSVLIFLAAYAVRQGPRLREFARGFLPACGVLLLVVGLIGKEDFGTAALIGAMGAVVLLVAGVRWWHLALLIPVAALGFYLLVYCNDYRWARVVAFLEGADGGRAQGGAYQARQSITAIASGGLWGKGLGAGAMKLGWIPEDTTDFVFAVVGEELGFAGCALLVALFVALLFCSMAIAHRAPDRLGLLLTVGIAGAIGAQAVMNLAVVTGLAPTKGIALPFVSAGGSGLILTAMATGILVNIARQGSFARQPTGAPRTRTALGPAGPPFIGRFLGEKG